MRTLPRPLSLAAALLVAALATLPSRAAAQCMPAACSSGTFQLVDFESFVPGTSVEGLGAVNPLLNITSVAWGLGPSCAVGSARVIQEGNPFPWIAYDTNTAVDNGCLGGVRGFADDAGCVLDYDFTFAGGITVNCFSIRIVDYGDFYPFGGATHQILLTAYDASNAIVDTDSFGMGGGVDLTAGDACTSQAGQAGNLRLTVTGTGIVKVTLRYDANPDPNIGYDEINFCAIAEPVPALPGSWGRMKSIYR